MEQTADRSEYAPYMLASSQVLRHNIRIMSIKTWSRWKDNLVRLIQRTTSGLPRDVERALERAHGSEADGSPAQWALETILENVRLARRREAPLCQDTGVLLFYVRVPRGFESEGLCGAIRAAVAGATESGLLRQNTIDTLSGSSRVTNIGAGAPVIHIQSDLHRSVEIKLLMKGGGSENVSAQYSLPDAGLGASRDWDGVRRCALDAVWRAQGMGCAPGVLGICIGGDRSSGAEFAKRQLLRNLNERTRSSSLAQLEKRILKDANASGIGPMGLGGRSTLLGVRIGALSRLPACYYVSVSYMCWALRRGGMMMRAADGSILKWLD